MSFFTKTVTKVIPFDDDTVTVTFKRLKRATALHVLVDEGSLSEKASRLLAMLPEQVVEFKGLKADGEEVTLQEAIEEQYFQPVIQQVIGAILDASNLGKADEGKSLAPPRDISRA